VSTYVFCVMLSHSFCCGTCMCTWSVLEKFSFTDRGAIRPPKEYYIKVDPIWPSGSREDQNAKLPEDRCQVIGTAQESWSKNMKNSNTHFCILSVHNIICVLVDHDQSWIIDTELRLVLILCIVALPVSKQQMPICKNECYYFSYSWTKTLELFLPTLIMCTCMYHNKNYVKA
jgi:hypothetical protein